MKYFKIYKNIALGLIILLGVVVGYIFLGPFFTSGVIEWFEGQPEIVRNLVDLESMVIDVLISSCVPMLIFWAIAFYGYNRFSTDLKTINNLFPLAWLFAESPATVILFLSSLLAGLCGYGWLEYSHSSSLTALSVLCVFFFIIGFVVRLTCTPHLKQSNFLDSHSVKIGHTCSLLGVSAYFWSVLANPVSLYMLIKSSV
jgi:hypothetical protein